VNVPAELLVGAAAEVFAAGALEVDIIESNESRYSFDVTRCKYAEMYNELGYGDLGEIFSCTRDFEFCSGFNSDVKLERTQTIMQGASHCDFRYSLDQPE
ncbi:MAG: L-2-amino-thiazoline-4-carboxylic acid hydrolase, partial [Chloroflexi bacterium]|nr:L-2-amino-thiazoline-4-carboxylic acid hydrolase [Chloroflexota bacterium]